MNRHARKAAVCACRRLDPSQVDVARDGTLRVHGRKQQARWHEIVLGACVANVIDGEHPANDFWGILRQRYPAIARELIGRPNDIIFAVACLAVHLQKQEA